MARLKISSEAFDKASHRMASVKNIDAHFDLGNNLTADNYQSVIDKVKHSMDEYNTQLSKVDGLRNQLRDDEQLLKDWSERILTGVASKYGKNSSQYLEAGGVKKSERKKPARRSKAA